MEATMAAAGAERAGIMSSSAQPAQRARRSIIAGLEEGKQTNSSKGTADYCVPYRQCVDNHSLAKGPPQVFCVVPLEVVFADANREGGLTRSGQTLVMTTEGWL
jgi:hypothetical protein